MGLGLHVVRSPARYQTSTVVLEDSLLMDICQLGALAHVKQIMSTIGLANNVMSVHKECRGLIVIAACQGAVQRTQTAPITNVPARKIAMGGRGQ